jgi:uncharacterized protein
MNEAQAFRPFEALAASLIPHSHEGDDGSHDLAHILRVFKNAMRIQANEGGDARVLAAAVLLHDCVAVEKNSPLRAQASALAAEKASTVLSGLGWSPSDIAAVAHAVLTHLQDADRLDAIGMVGAGRCFYIGGRMASALYDPLDPAGENRPLDDRRYVIDHFKTKLFKLADGFKTSAGRALAAERDKRLRDFLDAFMDEI